MWSILRILGINPSDTYERDRGADERDEKKVAGFRRNELKSGIYMADIK